MNNKEQNNGVLVFGIQEAGITYRHRPGAYALIYDQQRNICLVNTPEGYALPGGGIENDESKDEALRREIREETGYKVVIGPYIGTAFHFKHSPKEGYIKKECFYYACSFRFAERAPLEKDHVPEWYTYSEALEKLQEKEPAHFWAVKNFFASNL